MEEYSIGEYIIYRNGEKYELGRIKSLCEDGAFVAYHDGETGAKTPYSHMHKLINRYCIKDTSLGGDYFKADTPQTEKPKIRKRNDKPFRAVWVDDDLNEIGTPQTDCYMCKWMGDRDVCGRCRNRNLFAEADTEPKPKDEPQTDCPWK